MRRSLIGVASAAVLAFSGCELLGGITDREVARDGGGGDAAGVGGGSVGGGGMGGGGLGGCPIGSAGTPHGPEKLYFGVPMADLSLPTTTPESGHLSPDGLRFVVPAMTDTTKIFEYTRASLDDLTFDAPGFSQTVSFGLYPHLLGGNVGLFGCDPATSRCSYRTRSRSTTPFGDVPAIVYNQGPNWGGGAVDTAFVPTPDGALVAFSSNRLGPNDDSPSAAAPDLWIAAAVNAVDPVQDFQNLVHLVTASSGFEQVPSWFADDGLSLAFHSDQDGGWDLYFTERMDDAIGVGVKIGALSTDDCDEFALSMPSLERIKAAPCASTHAYFLRACGTDRAYMRARVCVGYPCPE